MRASQETYKALERRERLSVRSQIGLAAASLLLLLVYFQPIWKIELNAPQYPEGLGMYIEVNNIRGMNPGNLASINGLNHYIGMKAIDPDSIPELRLMPWLVAALIVLGIAAAASGRRWAVYTWIGLFVVLAVVGLVDFYLWEYDYGHNLDQERAIIKVPGMTYQPPLIGSKTMLNITATSYPALGGIAAFVSLAAGLLIAALDRRKLRGGMAAVATLLILGGCATGPRPIAYGEHVCQHCKMIIVDPRFGAELVTEKGKVLTFDSIECLTRHLAEVEGTAYLGGGSGTLWVTNLTEPGSLIPAETAFFVRSEALISPMGGYLGAFVAEADRERFLQEKSGEAMSWKDVEGASRLAAAP